MDEARDLLQEAREILAGTSLLLPEKGHIEALDDHYQVQLIKLANSLERVKQEVLNG